MGISGVCTEIFLSAGITGVQEVSLEPEQLRSCTITQIYTASTLGMVCQSRDTPFWRYTRDSNSVIAR